MLTYLSSPLRSKRTYPSEVANSVWSVPSPTLDPGLNRVPRCRTMMLPAVTNCPPKRLTPSRWALESRPLRELPTPFLCAMSLCLDLGYADGGHDLPVPALPSVILPPLELDHEDLAVLLLRDDLARDLRAGQRLRLGRYLPVLGDEQHLVELDRGARGLAQPLDLDDLPRGYPVLLPARRDHRFHVWPFFLELD